MWRRTKPVPFYEPDVPFYPELLRGLLGLDVKAWFNSTPILEYHTMGVAIPGSSCTFDR